MVIRSWQLFIWSADFADKLAAAQPGIDGISLEGKDQDRERGGRARDGEHEQPDKRWPR